MDCFYLIANLTKNYKNEEFYKMVSIQFDFTDDYTTFCTTSAACRLSSIK